MPKKIDEKKKRKVVAALAEGKTEKVAAREAGVAPSTAHEFQSVASEIKKQVRTEWERDTKDRISALSKRLLSVVESAAESLTPEKIAACSPAAIATVLGIVTDKMQLLTGGATENFQLNFTGKQQTLEFLRGKRVLTLKQPNNNNIPELPCKEGTD